MKIKIYNTVQEFLDENEKLLLEKEALTQLILHNAFVNKEKKTNKEIVFGRIEDEKNSIKLIFTKVDPYNLLIHSFDCRILDSIELLAEYFIKENISIKGINASKIICDKFIKYYEEKVECRFKEYLSMDIMEVKELNKEIILPKGNFRLARLEDKGLIIEWCIKFIHEALNEEESYLDQKDKVEERIKNKKIYIFEDEKNIPMAMIAVGRQLINGISISYVYSRKEARGKGYGLAVAYNLSKECLEKGNKFCTLFVDKKNPISNGVYKKVGYKILEDNYDYRII